MAEKKEKKYVAASEDSKKARQTKQVPNEDVIRAVKEAKPVGNPTPPRIGVV